MKANELRIGNYYDNHGQIGTITPSNIMDVAFSQRTWCKPIPITEEWLVKFGFRNSINSKYYYIIKETLVVGFNPSGVCIVIDDDNGEELAEMYFNHIKHVHQLQNLYFALTGEELTTTP